ncbi:hypothetical protein U9M48_040812, partial [Paspalum notatum var. saurae]
MLVVFSSSFSPAGGLPRRRRGLQRLSEAQIRHGRRCLHLELGRSAGGRSVAGAECGRRGERGLRRSAGGAAGATLDGRGEGEELRGRARANGSIQGSGEAGPRENHHFGDPPKARLQSSGRPSGGGLGGRLGVPNMDQGFGWPGSGTQNEALLKILHKFYNKTFTGFSSFERTTSRM